MNYFLVLSGILCAWAMLSIISSERSMLISDLKRRLGSGQGTTPATPLPDPNEKAKPVQAPPQGKA